ncbi:MAG: hypothetical protein QM308_07630 [Bacillota bacterium]|nr:hypothetical protein [Bacillota bacterium]
MNRKTLCLLLTAFLLISFCATAETNTPQLAQATPGINDSQQPDSEKGPDETGQPHEMKGSSYLAPEILPDGRVLTRPFHLITEPLPEVPPQSELIIPGTEWFTDPLICGIDEGVKVPVYASPAFNSPIIDWVGLDDQMDYGLYLFSGWVMMYNPKWVETAGIGFMTFDVIDFPGIEE